MTEILMTIALFNGIVLVLTTIILVARKLVVDTGEATVRIEGGPSVLTELGVKLHTLLAESGIAMAATCGGRGTCGACRVRLSGELEPPLPTELALLGEHALARGLRLACQVTVRGDLEVGLPDGITSASSFEATVRSARLVTALIKEVVLDLPESADFQFRAGSFVQLTCPPHRTALGSLGLEPAFQSEWAQLGLNKLIASCSEPTTRAYSLANHPGEGRFAMLLVRLALPPAGAPKGTPPGVVSSYVFALQTGDRVRLAGPFGHFMASGSGREMVFVAGGVGLAPMRAHVFEQLEVLKARHRISLWYGARSQRDILYAEDFDRLARDHDNFSWSVALSEPKAEGQWEGATGFIHEHLHQAHLAAHPSPAECEYYLCGPPLMIRAVLAMLERFGVARSAIYFDDFGA